MVYFKMFAGAPARESINLSLNIGRFRIIGKTVFCLNLIGFTGFCAVTVAGFSGVYPCFGF